MCAWKTFDKLIDQKSGLYIKESIPWKIPGPNLFNKLDATFKREIYGFPLKTPSGISRILFPAKLIEYKFPQPAIASAEMTSKLLFWK